ncbi:TetR/AcrR family transcriptional regulator [Bacillus sp. 1P10SD]|uniref:TetR/AcrR family transcriptional regulator n=1 Tax=Bacillus sp. 1P10SD TaxID=3132265 RepID=UPI0039A4E0F5
MGKDSKYTGEINPKETYQLIIKTAERLFMEYGYRAVSTRQIADLCDITQPALYHHFKNKQTLYVAVIEHVLHHTEKDLNGILAQFTTFQERLIQITTYMMDQFEMDMSQMFHDMHHELSLDDQQRVHQLWVKGFLMPIVTMINDGVSNGEIKNPEELDSNSTEMAFLILNIIKSILQPSNMGSLPKHEQTAMVKHKASLIVEIFLKGISR